MFIDTHHIGAWQTDDRIAAPLVAAMHGFKQVGIRSLRELDERAQGCIEVGKYLKRNGYSVVSLAGQVLELFRRHHTHL